MDVLSRYESSAGFPADIRTKKLSNASLEHYRYDNTLSDNIKLHIMHK
jgi:hypothetical protein